MKTLALSFIRLYQLMLSPFLGTACRFTPTCSQYAGEAINTHGVVKGGVLAVRRLCKCHPFTQPDFDPVP
jgi:putative membrane protein insertion efficiency factor